MNFNALWFGKPGAHSRQRSIWRNYDASILREEDRPLALILDIFQLKITAIAAFDNYKRYRPHDRYYKYVTKMGSKTARLAKRLEGIANSYNFENSTTEAIRSVSRIFKAGCGTGVVTWYLALCILLFFETRLSAATVNVYQTPRKDVGNERKETEKWKNKNAYRNTSSSVSDYSACTPPIKWLTKLPQRLKNWEQSPITRP